MPVHFKRIAYAAAVFTVILPIGILLSWADNLPSLPRFPSDFQTIKPNTALGILLCGLALWVQIHEPVTFARRRVAQTCAALASILAVATLVEYLFSVPLSLNPVRFSPMQVEADASIWDMSPPTAFALLQFGPVEKAHNILLGKPVADHKAAFFT